MGIFDKLSRVIRSNINDLISKAENPEKMLNQVILDMRDQLARAKREVAAAIADERKLRAQLDEEAKQGREWEHRAMLAVKEGRDDLAKQALVRQQEHAERAAALEQTWRAQAQETEKLKASLRQLNDKIEEAKRKRNLLIAKQKRAQAQRRIHETMSGLSDTSAFEAFNRMADKIEESERRTLAAAEVDQALETPSLEEEFKQLESGGESTSTEDRLLALKREMGMLPPAEDEEPRQLGPGEAEDVAEAEGPPVQEAEFEEVPEGEEDDGASEAELLAEFEQLEGRPES
ncbi:MAG: PspA/IM30 family protein [Gemmatimonadota bacterium]|jgi:phage shock protein A